MRLEGGENDECRRERERQRDRERQRSVKRKFWKIVRNVLVYFRYKRLPMSIYSQSQAQKIIFTCI